MSRDEVWRLLSVLCFLTGMSPHLQHWSLCERHFSSDSHSTGRVCVLQSCLAAWQGQTPDDSQSPYWDFPACSAHLDFHSRHDCMDSRKRWMERSDLKIFPFYYLLFIKTASYSLRFLWLSCHNHGSKCLGVCLNVTWLCSKGWLVLRSVSRDHCGICPSGVLHRKRHTQSPHHVGLKSWVQESPVPFDDCSFLAF